MAGSKRLARADEGLRAHLRAATMAAHDLLDASMQASSGWRSRADYARFLALQHAARAPLEDWLDTHAPAALRPPRQTALIARDLAALGHAVPAPTAQFAHGKAERGDVIGAAWVLAGSALGNRYIARQVDRIGGGVWPVAFLGDEAMLAFWQALRSRIEREVEPAEAAGATRAATAVFAHFLGVSNAAQRPAERAELAP